MQTYCICTHRPTRLEYHFIGLDVLVHDLLYGAIKEQFAL
jgi:hypothetical protein